MSYQQYRPNSLQGLPPVVKNLLIINGLFFIATFVLEKQGIDLVNILGLHYPLSPAFKPWQIVTYMFMHGGVAHILLNMFGLWMFGKVLENLWGSKRFLIFYMLTGFGAAAMQIAVAYFRLIPLYKEVSAENLNLIMTQGSDILAQSKNFIDPIAASMNDIVNAPCVGASGALFGLLAAFGMLFPNTELFIMFIPIPIKAKYAVSLYAAYELFSGVENFQGDNVAHFAHLGGAIVGFILVKYWQKKNTNFY
jgi:membrane associated rhomboid family serine protease